MPKSNRASRDCFVPNIIGFHGHQWKMIQDMYLSQPQLLPLYETPNKHNRVKEVSKGSGVK